MLKTISLALAFCATAHAQTLPAGHQPGEEAAILDVMDAYMHEISANDMAAMEARQYRANGTSSGVPSSKVALQWSAALT